MCPTLGDHETDTCRSRAHTLTEGRCLGYQKPDGRGTGRGILVVAMRKVNTSGRLRPVPAALIACVQTPIAFRKNLKDNLLGRTHCTVGVCLQHFADPI